MAVNKTFWIGLVKNRSLGIFRWSNGQRLSYQNWIVMPNISKPEDCGEMTDYSVFRGMWNDQSCSAMLPFICEKGDVKNKVFAYFSFPQQHVPLSWQILSIREIPRNACPFSARQSVGPEY